MSSTPPPLTRDSVLAAHSLIRGSIHETPVLTSRALSQLASTPQTAAALAGTRWSAQPPARPLMRLFFKAENLQRAGAFKIRGATHALRRLAAAGELDPARGVCTHSSGNHAQALALAAREAGVPAHVVMPSISTPSKIAATRAYGATVVFSGSTEDERLEVLAGVAAETGARLVPPFDHADIVLGQGTMAVETERQVEEMVRRRPALSCHGRGGEGATASSSSSAASGEAPQPLGGASLLGGAPSSPPLQDHGVRLGKPRSAPQPGRLDALVAPLGGGGMLAGNALFFGPTPTLVFGAEPSFQGADDGRRGLAQVPPTRVEHVSTLTVADGLRTPVGQIPWSVISDRTKMEGVYAVDEGQIKAAMRLLLERLKVLVEPSAAVPFAVILFDEDFRTLVEREGGSDGWDVGIVLSGGNTTVEAIASLYGDVGSASKERAEGAVGMDGERTAENVAG